MIHWEKKVKTSIRYAPKAAQNFGRKQFMHTTTAMLIPDFAAKQSLRTKDTNSADLCPSVPKISLWAVHPKLHEHDVHDRREEVRCGQ